MYHQQRLSTKRGWRSDPHSFLRSTQPPAIIVLITTLAMALLWMSSRSTLVRPSFLVKCLMIFSYSPDNIYFPLFFESLKCNLLILNSDIHILGNVLCTYIYIYVICISSFIILKLLAGNLQEKDYGKSCFLLLQQSSLVLNYLK